MAVDKDLILKLENLARLRLSEKEREKIASDLEEILQMVEKLKEVDTEGIEPLVYLNEEATGWREDKIKKEDIHEKAGENAPDFDNSFFKVPKVIDH